MFAGQSKIYSYMSPNKCSGMRSPLQEENSVAHHEVKCQGKPIAGIYRRREGKPLKWAWSDLLGRSQKPLFSILCIYPAFSIPGSFCLNRVLPCYQKITARRGEEWPSPGSMSGLSNRFCLLLTSVSTAFELDKAPDLQFKRLTSAKSAEIMSLGCTKPGNLSPI